MLFVRFIPLVWKWQFNWFFCGEKKDWMNLDKFTINRLRAIVINDCCFVYIAPCPMPDVHCTYPISSNWKYANRSVFFLWSFSNLLLCNKWCGRWFWILFVYCSLHSSHCIFSTNVVRFLLRTCISIPMFWRTYIILLIIIIYLKKKIINKLKNANRKCSNGN